MDKYEEISAAVKKKFGFVPNLFRTLSISPAVAEVYLMANAAMEGARIPPREAQAVNLAISRENGCRYCMAAHTAMGKMVGIEESELELIKSGCLPEDPALAAATGAARLIMSKRGWLTGEELADLEQGGIDRAKIYEIIALIGIETIANYVNHVAKTEIDKEFSQSS